MGLSIAVAGGIICVTVLAIFSIVFSLSGQVYEINSSKTENAYLQNTIIHTNTSIGSMSARSASDLVEFSLNNTGNEKLWDYEKFAVIVTYDADIMGFPTPTTEELTYDSSSAFAEAGCDCQFARPDSDVSKENWDDAFGGDNDDILYDEINEVTRNDTNYASSGPLDGVLDSSETWEVGLSDIEDPLTSSDHIVRYVYKKRFNGSPNLNLSVSLMEGATPIASWNHINIGHTFTLATQTLSTAEADSITDYTDLRLRFVATFNAGGPGNNFVDVSWAEFEASTVNGIYDCSPVAISAGEWTIDRMNNDLHDPEIINTYEDGQICIKLSNSISGGSVHATVSTDLGKTATNSTVAN